MLSVTMATDRCRGPISACGQAPLLWILLFGLVTATGLETVGHATSSPGVGCVRSLKSGLPVPSSNRSSWISPGGSYGIEYDCYLRTLSNGNDSLNIRPEDWARSSAIRVQCNDALLFESFLTVNQTLFKLINLQKLEIRSCKLRKLPAGVWSNLTLLKSLSVRTKNSQWSNSISLEIQPGSFNDSLAGLQSLDLSDNNLWAMPENLLCPLRSLNVLNLSRNRLAEMEELSEERNSTRGGDRVALCVLPRLQQVDLSFNALRQVVRISRGWSSVERLQLQHNLIEELEDSAFSELSLLKSVNLSCNRLVALPPTIFKFNPQLREIYLANNSISALAPAVFSRLGQLLMLDLTRNTLTSQWIRQDMFHNLKQLRVLKLSFNQLSVIDSSIFQDLSSLQVLELDNNRIETISPGAFQSMRDVRSIDLMHNRLTHLPGNLLSNIPKLRQLYLDHNKIKSVDDDALVNTTSLQDLGLAGNLLQEVPVALQIGLSVLRSLDLGENRIFVVSNDSFRGLSQLYGLRMVDNRLSELPDGFCDPLRKLRVLNLAQNRLLKIGARALISCPELRALRLDSNSLESLPPSLTPQLPSLLWLNVSENKLTTADYRSLPPSIEWLDLSHNSLESFSETWSSSSRPGNIRVLDLSFNKLTQLKMTMIPRSVETIRVNHNKLNSVAPDTFLRLSRLRRVELTANQLQFLPLTSLKLSSGSADRRAVLGAPSSSSLLGGGNNVAEFYLGGNPLLCDCSMEWLLRLHQHYSGTPAVHSSNYRAGTSPPPVSLPFGQYPRIVDLDAISCHLPRGRNGSETGSAVDTGQDHEHALPLAEMHEEDFYCSYKTHCDKNCHCCDFDACDCAMVCPQGCECFHDAAWSKNIVQCSGPGSKSTKGLQTTDENEHKDISRLPMTATEIYLDGNNIPVLSSHVFIGKRYLKKLHLNDSRVANISNKTFNGLISLEILRLEENLLAGIYGYEFSDLLNLRELYLQNNLLTFIGRDTFTPLKMLSVLRIDGNMLTTIHIPQLNPTSHRLSTLLLAANPWTCECEFVIPFRSWLLDRQEGHVFTDLSAVTCTQASAASPPPFSSSSSAYSPASTTKPDTSSGATTLLTEICPLPPSNDRLRFRTDNLIFPPPLLSNLIPEGATLASRGSGPVGPSPSSKRGSGEGRKRNFLPSPLEVLPDNSSTGLLWTLIVTSGGLLMLILALLLIFRKEIYYRLNDRLSLFSSSVNGCCLCPGRVDGEAWACTCGTEDCQHKKCAERTRRRGGAGGTTGIFNGISPSANPSVVLGGSSSSANFGNSFFFGPDDSEKLFDAYFLYSAGDEETLVEKIVGELEHGSGDDNGTGNGGGGGEGNFYRLCLHYRDLCLSPGNPLNCEMVLGACDSSKRIVLLLSRTFLANEWTNMDFRQTITQAISRHHKRFIVILQPCLNSESWNSFAHTLLHKNELPILNNKPLSNGINLNMINSIKSSVIHFQDANFWPKLKVLFPPPSVSNLFLMTAHRRGGFPPFTTHTNQRRQQRYYQPRIAASRKGVTSSMTTLPGRKRGVVTDDSSASTRPPQPGTGGDQPPPLPPPRNSANMTETALTTAATITTHCHKTQSSVAQELRNGKCPNSIIARLRPELISQAEAAGSLPNSNACNHHLIGNSGTGIALRPQEEEDDHLYSSLSECPTLPCRGNKNQTTGIISSVAVTPGGDSLSPISSHSSNCLNNLHQHCPHANCPNLLSPLSPSSSNSVPSCSCSSSSPSSCSTFSPSSQHLARFPSSTSVPHATSPCGECTVSPSRLPKCARESLKSSRQFTSDVAKKHGGISQPCDVNPALSTGTNHPSISLVNPGGGGGEATPMLNTDFGRHSHGTHVLVPESHPCIPIPSSILSSRKNSNSSCNQIQSPNQYSNQELFTATSSQPDNSPRTEAQQERTSPPPPGDSRLGGGSTSKPMMKKSDDFRSSAPAPGNPSPELGNGPGSGDLREINGVTKMEARPRAHESANSTSTHHPQQSQVNNSKQPMYFV